MQTFYLNDSLFVGLACDLAAKTRLAHLGCFWYAGGAGYGVSFSNRQISTCAARLIDSVSFQSKLFNDKTHH